MPTAQQQQLERVRDRIADAILAFALAWPGEWHMDDLRRFVERHVGRVAPASPDRILRALRAEQRLNYRVVSRPQSLYAWEPVPPPPAPAPLDAVRQADFGF
jgi:hypothetical protein